MAHLDLYFLDGSNPPEPILQRFLRFAEETDGAIAVRAFCLFCCCTAPRGARTLTTLPSPAPLLHADCKAGLGRTGSCIGAYLMKHYGFSAREAIGWMRVCRPGSVIGPQQQYLESIESRMWEEGALFRRSRRLPQPVASSLLARLQNSSASAPTPVCVIVREARVSARQPPILPHHTPPRSLLASGESRRHSRRALSINCRRLPLQQKRSRHLVAGAGMRPCFRPRKASDKLSAAAALEAWPRASLLALHERVPALSRVFVSQRARRVLPRVARLPPPQTKRAAPGKGSSSAPQKIGETDDSDPETWAKSFLVNDGGDGAASPEH
jgi:hypothetical protein